MIEACCNYGRTADHPELSYYALDGDEVPADGEAMYDLWADAADAAVRAAAAGGAQVWWVITPPLDPSAPLHDRVERFDRIARNLSDNWPALRSIDWGLVTTTSSGTLLDHVATADGKSEPLRTDGVHFSDAANALLTQLTVRSVLGEPG